MASLSPVPPAAASRGIQWFPAPPPRVRPASSALAPEFASTSSARPAQPAVRSAQLFLSPRAAAPSAAASGPEAESAPPAEAPSSALMLRALLADCDAAASFSSSAPAAASSSSSAPAAASFRSSAPAAASSSSSAPAAASSGSSASVAASFRSSGPASARSSAGKPARPDRCAMRVSLSATQFDSLSREQRAVVIAVLEGANVFFTGCAGTGKTHLLQMLAELLPSASTFFTASTGLAAVNLGGTTLHSFAGVGLGEDTVAKLVARARGNQQCRKRWLDCKVLVIDEVSMISGALFDKVEAVARGVRGSLEPFGGIQLILSGDFLQLPPVNASKQAFDADAWNDCVQVKLVLQQAFRQQGDPAFVQLLDGLRMGELSAEGEALLTACSQTSLPPLNGVLPTKLHALKRDTGSENERHLALLQPHAYTYRARDVSTSAPHMEMLRKNCPGAELLTLKVGAQVMLLKNIAPGLCNGSRGIIVDFAENPLVAGMLLPRVRFENGALQLVLIDKWDISVNMRPVATRWQLPLTLAWALTIHKSQGMTLERAEINANGIFECGQLYVAVSRVKSMLGLRLTGFTRSALRTDPLVVAWYAALAKDTAHATDELLAITDRYFPRLEQRVQEEQKRKNKGKNNNDDDDDDDNSDRDRDRDDNDGNDNDNDNDGEAAE